MNGGRATKMKPSRQNFRKNIKYRCYRTNDEFGNDDGDDVTQNIYQKAN